LDVQDVIGWTPLHHAATHGHTECVKFLLDNKASTSLMTRQRETIAQFITRIEHPEIIAILENAV